MEQVLVLMSTYDGERYLREQIDSILAQEGVKVHLLVRDDGSKDNTCLMLDEYSQRYNNIDVVKADNVGFVKSFSKLIEMAQDYPIHADYFAFSDQDDVWMPKKLKIAVEYLSKIDQDKPLLFSSNSIYVDENMKELGLFHKEEPYRTKENVMIYPTEQGCSMVFNINAIKLYNFHKPNISWHDRWMVFICNFMGEMMYCHEPLFYYRLHGDNTLGDQLTLRKRIHNNFDIIVNNTRMEMRMIEEFYYSFEQNLTSSDVASIKVYLDYRKSIINKKALIMSPQFQRSLSLWNRFRKAILIIFNRL